MLVFRDGRRSGAAETLLGEVAVAVRRFLGAPGADGAALEALLLAGHAEAAVFDSALANDAEAADALVQLTDSLADTELWRGTEAAGAGALAPVALAPVAQALARLELVRSRLPRSAELTVSVPEGFAFYDVHPNDFAEAAATALLASNEGRRCSAGGVAHDGPGPRKLGSLGPGSSGPASSGADCSGSSWLTVGVRTIGATLAAVVAARLRRLGQNGARFTVRPTGHPFARTLSLTPAQRDALARTAGAGGGVLVVDEGPGLSGSSILATTDALEAAGCPVDRILVVCTYAPDPAKLRAPEAARRWGRLRVAPAAAAANRARKVAGARELAPGSWREMVFASPASWPASWTAFERRKLLTGDGRLLKFAGLGPWGRGARKRADRMAEAGYGPAVATAEIDGYIVRPWLSGDVLERGSLTPELLVRMTEYLAWRSRELAAVWTHASDAAESERASDSLREMTAVNLAEAGFAIGRIRPLEVVRPTVPDARLMPHEWLRDARGRLTKLDGTDHGDDHFYPGPTDVAWDLAGLLVEWGLDGAGEELAIDRYERLSGDRVRSRLAAYRLAYLAFRVGYCRLAAESLAGSEEAPRLFRAETLYREQTSRCLASHDN